MAAHDRRRELAQNLLADRRVLRRFVDSLDLTVGELVVDVGAGRGAITRALLDRDVEVVAVEIDPRHLAALHDLRRRLRATDRARLHIVDAPLEHVTLPRIPYRVVANPPFNATTTLLRRLLDDPTIGPTRADLILQREVAIKRSAPVPDTLLSASWAPWWTTRLGMRIDRHAFDPVPRVDAAVLVAELREQPILPSWLAPDFAAVLRRRWEDGP